MKPRYFVLLATGIAALVGLAKATETTSVYRQGGSTATITQDDGGSSSPMRRLIRRGSNSQTIVQQQGGSRTTITQSVEEGPAEDLESEELDAMEGDDW